MKNFIKRSLLPVVLLAVTSFGANAADKVIVATDTAFVPFEFKKDNKYVGFDIDLWDAIAKKLKLDYEIRPMDFNGIIPGLQTGNIDVAIAGITIKSKREEVIDYSYPYYKSGISIMVRTESDEINDVTDLKDKIIAVKQGTAAADYVDTLGAKEVKKYPNIDNAYLELRTGRVDVAMHDTPNILYYIKEAGNNKVKRTGPNLDAQYYGIAFPNGSNLRDKVNVALLDLIETGEYDKIYQKWFNTKPE